MIIDLQKFIREEQPYWRELDAKLDRMEADSWSGLSLKEARRLHYLYQRAVSDLARVKTFASEAEMTRYLESLVARAYGEIHQGRPADRRRSPLRWFFRTFPRTFRAHFGAFLFASACMAAGGLFGAFALSHDSEAKEIIMPFSHLLDDPSDRVAREEEGVPEGLEGGKGTFSAFLITHNTRVAITTLCLGITWGIGTLVILFYNGVILAGVGMDYLAAGEGTFLFAWLLPHGSIEIPAILVAGQAGFVLAGALVGWRNEKVLKVRLREIVPVLATLIGGTAVLLVWAGLIEAFFSQYHAPVLPYSVKIAFGGSQLILLILFLARSGAGGGRETHERFALQ